MTKVNELSIELQFRYGRVRLCSGVQTLSQELTRILMSFVMLKCSGGMELLFDNQKTIQARVPAHFPAGAGEADGEERHEATMRDLIPWISQRLLKERPELFIGDDGSV
jgi:hypothetical protein